MKIFIILGETHKHQSGLNHIFYHIVGLFGISDHKVIFYILDLQNLEWRFVINDCDIFENDL